MSRAYTRAGEIPWAHISPEPNSGCWLWTGAFESTGYGHLKRHGHGWQAHRYIYTLLRGEVPRELTLDHLCRIRSCVNPAHLEPVTSRVNILRGVGLAARQVLRAHCPRGHPYEGENLQWFGRHRRCRICTNMHHRNSYRRRTAGA